jgi:hypothetical protein
MTYHDNHTNIINACLHRLLFSTEILSCVSMNGDTLLTVLVVMLHISLQHPVAWNQGSDLHTLMLNIYSKALLSPSITAKSILHTH